MAAQVDPVGLDGVDVQVLPREAIVTQLAVFLDERTRPQLSLAQLKMLQVVPSPVKFVQQHCAGTSARELTQISHPTLNAHKKRSKRRGSSLMPHVCPANRISNRRLSAQNGRRCGPRHGEWPHAPHKD